MIAMRKSLWAGLAMAALVTGCGGEETTAPAEAPTSGPGPAPTGPPPGSGEMKAMPTPAPAEAAPAPAEKKDEPPKAEAPATEPPKGASNVKLEDAEIAEIKKLPAGEVEFALKQAVCPVSDEHLGSMGAPIKVTAEGKTFYLCCKGCNKDLEKDPKAVVAKLVK